LNFSTSRGCLHSLVSLFPSLTPPKLHLSNHFSESHTCLPLLKNHVIMLDHLDNSRYSPFPITWPNL
jgi:hypothetical protein